MFTKNTPSLLLGAGLLALLAATAQAKIERVVEKTFTAQPGGTLTLETQGGDIRVMPGSDNQVHVTARERIHASTEAEADALLEKLTLTMEQNGNDVTAVAKYPKKSGLFGFRSWPPVQVSFDVTVPAHTSTDLRTSGGDIRVGDLAGRMQIRTSGGDVTAGMIDGEVHALTSGGDIDLKQATGHTRLGTSGGNIKVGRVLGSADLSTSGGDIGIGGVEGALKAHTSGGDVTASIQGPLQQDCSIGTSGGDVRVKLDHNVGFNLDAATSGGGIDARGITITIDKGGAGKSRLSGTVNGGGPQLRLRTSGGNIEIRTH